VRRRAEAESPADAAGPLGRHRDAVVLGRGHAERDAERRAGRHVLGHADGERGTRDERVWQAGGFGERGACRERVRQAGWEEAAEEVIA
jgi:hypothetical protein